MSPVWPPANFSDWPATRIAALIFNLVVVIILLIPGIRRTCLWQAWTCFCGDHFFFLLTIIKALSLGCLGGIWLHFVPCLWWTCDWGDSDGQGVRGAIWFVTWGLLFVVIVWWECRRRENNNQQEQEHDLEEAEVNNKEEAAATGKQHVKDEPV